MLFIKLLTNSKGFAKVSRERVANMAKEDIDKWANKRLKTPEGQWIKDKSPLGPNSGSDVMFCILCSMENRIPHSDEPKLTEEYQRLVELACDFLSTHFNLRELYDLKTRVTNDAREVGWYRYVQKLPSIQQLFDTCHSVIDTLMYKHINYSSNNCSNSLTSFLRSKIFFKELCVKSLYSLVLRNCFKIISFLHKPLIDPSKYSLPLDR